MNLQERIFVYIVRMWQKNVEIPAMRAGVDAKSRVMLLWCARLRQQIGPHYPIFILHGVATTFAI